MIISKYSLIATLALTNDLGGVAITVSSAPAECVRPFFIAYIAYTTNLWKGVSSISSSRCKYSYKQLLVAKGKGVRV